MIAVIDYGLGNLRSVSKALEAIGAEVEVTNNTEKVAGAKAIVLPGVGAFSRGMENLKAQGILPSILRSIKAGKPFLGICLGLQLLFTESQEHGTCNGLDIIKGKVKRLTNAVKIPHMGWNQVKINKPKANYGKPDLFRGIPNNSYFYFVHSYYVEPDDKSFVMGKTEYGLEFVSVVNRDNVWGVQFHPEKSAGLGLKFLENFCHYVG
jgi:glutamine amidotransferase